MYNHMHKFYTILLVAVLLSSCSGNELTVQSPEGYDLAHPEKFILPEPLLEVSGISFKDGSSDTLYAVQDEEGKLFYLPLGKKEKTHFRFSKRGDFEDISLLGQEAIVLRSDGTLFRFSTTDKKQPVIDTVTEEWKEIVPKGEYEGLFADAATRQLYVLCKQCDKDAGVSGYILQLQGDSSIALTKPFSINNNAMAQLTGEKKLKFQPSALAKHPLTGQWYVLSSVNKLLVITDTNWVPVAAYPLDPSRFRQPEGIAFDTQHNLYISNEGDELSNGNVLKFVFTKPN